MTKKLLTLLIGMGSLTAFAQDAAKNAAAVQKVVITGKLDTAPNDSLLTVYEPYTGEWDTTRIKNHQFKVTRLLPKGGSVHILMIGTAGKEENATILYLEDGKVDIRGKGPAFKDAKYTGSPWVKDWVEVFNMVGPENPEMKKFKELEAMYIKASQIGDEDKADEYNKQGAVIEKKLTDGYKKWIADHSNSGVTGYLLTCYIKGHKEQDSIYATLGEHAKASRILQRFANPGKVDPSPVSFNMGEGGEANAGNPKDIKVGEVAPDFSAPDVNGKMVSLADFKGKYVFIDFWASWCGPCKPQIPFLKAAYDKYKGDNFVMMAVSLDSKREAWTKAIEKHELPWLNLSNLKGWGEPAAGVYGITFVPANILIGPDGKVLAKNLYDENLEKKLAELIKPGVASK
ncbi:AhpC/TSA family protein [Chitinophaga silvatica]|uniref:AhpC/TSA family protein n=1 Tax=Chitinophaga silvatica TaxID=2282649 RepID=A0A3E1Y3P0_9BACT|nr:TlpA disulfide reductase family protein [Chitinophaga silvatica]RFS19266.1 AhpC/TSA family protein [Chitinophaga silvatica]